MQTPPVSLDPNQAVIGSPPDPGLVFPDDGSGLVLDAGYPLTFPPQQPGELAVLFPTVLPRVEEMVYQTVAEAASTHATFPADGSGLPLPFAFGQPPRIGVWQGRDDTNPLTDRQPLIPVNRGWPAYPGQVPAIGVAEASSSEDLSDDAIQGGFAGDVAATDPYGNVIATAAYYAEPLAVDVVVELIHTNRDERDRLHDQLRAVLFSMRHIYPQVSPQIRDVHVTGEKQDMPLDEQPVVMFISLFTVTVRAEMLVPTDVVYGGVVTRVDTTVEVLTPTPEANAPLDTT